MFDTPFIIPVVALMIPIVAIISRNWARVQHRKLDLLEKSSTGLADAAQARIEKLEARIAVLERIATDRQLSLAEQIDELRH